MSLHGRIGAELDRREKLAREAEEWHPSPWKYSAAGPAWDAIVDGNRREVLSFRHHAEPTTFAVDFVENCAPADALRRYAAARRVLERHTGRVGHCWDPFNDAPAYYGPYCPEVRDLASSLGLEVDA